MCIITWTYAVFQGSHNLSEMNWTCLIFGILIFSHPLYNGMEISTNITSYLVISPGQHETLNQVCSQNLHQSSYRTKQIPQLCQHLLHPSCPSKREKQRNILISLFFFFFFIKQHNVEWKQKHTNNARAAAAQKENRVSISPVKMTNRNYGQGIYTTQ